MTDQIEDVEGPSEPMWTLSLRMDQWDLIVLAMQSIRNMASGDTTYQIDQLARRFLRRRCDEIVKDIQDVVDGAGK